MYDYYLVMFRSYSWLYAQEAFLRVLREPYVISGIVLGPAICIYARQMSLFLYDLSSLPIIIWYVLNAMMIYP